MKIMLVGFAAAALLALGAWAALDALDYTSASTASADSVRLGDAGPDENGFKLFD